MGLLYEYILIGSMHVISLAGNTVYYKAVVAEFIQHLLVLAFLVGTLLQLLLQGPDLTLLNDTFYQAVVTRHKYDKQEQRKYYPVLVLAQKNLELR